MNRRNKSRFPSLSYVKGRWVPALIIAVAVIVLVFVISKFSSGGMNVSNPDQGSSQEDASSEPIPELTAGWTLMDTACGLSLPVPPVSEVARSLPNPEKIGWENEYVSEPSSFADNGSSAVLTSDESREVLGKISIYCRASSSPQDSISAATQFYALYSSGDSFRTEEILEGGIKKWGREAYVVQANDGLNQDRYSYYIFSDSQQVYYIGIDDPDNLIQAKPTELILNHLMWQSSVKTQSQE